MPELEGYSKSYCSMTWLGPQGYPKQANGGRCYITGLLGQMRHFGLGDVSFADGASGDGFSFRWCPSWGCPAFNGGAGAFHEIWEYMPQVMGFRSNWKMDPDGGWDEAWLDLRALVDRGIPVQVGTHYSLIRAHGATVSPRLAELDKKRGRSGNGHHVIVSGYDTTDGTVSIYEPNDLPQYAKFKTPIEDFRQAWMEAGQRVNGRYKCWSNHKPFDGEWTLHDGYGPYLMVWVEPERDPDWNILAAIRSSFPRNLKILRGDYPKPYALFGNQWQIPLWETGAPGMAACAEAIKAGRLGDVVGAEGETLALFADANIPNHGVLGRLAAAKYLKRVGTELERIGTPGESLSAASEHMEHSSELFKVLRYERDLMRAAAILSEIAENELCALRHMEAALPLVLELGDLRGARLPQ